MTPEFFAVYPAVTGKPVGRPVRIDRPEEPARRIIREVAREFEIHASLVYGEYRDRVSCAARAESIRRIRNELMWPKTVIAKFLDRDFCVVAHALGDKRKRSHWLPKPVPILER